MAHEFESGFFYRTPAWHRLGIVLDDRPTIDEAIIRAGLDWDVTEKPIYLGEELTPAVLDDDGETVTPADVALGENVSSHKALIRSTDNRVLGIVGKNYTPLQNIEAFKFFDQVLADGDAALEAAGSLRNGQRVWVLAKINNSTADVVNNDPTCAYLCLYNSHDGTLAVGIMFTPIRIVCANTLQAALNYADSKKVARISIRHTAGMKDALEITKQAINLSRQTFDYTVEQYRTIAKKQLPINGIREYVREIFTLDKEDKDPRCLSKVEENHVKGIGSDIPGVQGTYWGAFNAFTEWLDHQRGRSEDTRLDSSWFGPSANLRAKAFEVALSHATGMSDQNFGTTVQ